MDEPFDLPVSYKRKELLFPAQLLQYGYTHKFQVDVHELLVLYEPDEERNYRAVVTPEQVERSKVDVGLLKAIANAIEEVIRQSMASFDCKDHIEQISKHE
ncbi:MAG: hypothetical protein M3342_16585 [Bacteroidota bacterium]|nr:hypothetical protein [Bacteroidota bacterium]